MIDERLQEEYIQRQSEPVEFPAVTEEQFNHLVDWARTCLQKMQEQSVSNLSSLRHIPAPSKFVADDFPIAKDLLDEIVGGFSNCAIDVHVKLFAKSFALAAIDNFEFFILAHHALPHRECALDGFHEGVAKLFVSNADKVRSTFRELANAYADNPAMIGVRREECEYYLQEVEKIKKTTSVLAIWDCGRVFDCVHCNYYGVGLFSLALRLELELGIELLERVCLPHVCEMVLSHSEVLHDRKILLELLSKAPSFVAAADGAQFSGIVAPFVLEYYQLHVVRITKFLHRSGHHNPKNAALEVFETEEAPQLFKKAAEVLLAREDAKLLGCNWLCHLSKSSRRRGASGRWSASDVFGDVLADQMNGYTFEDFREALGWSLPSVEKLNKAQALGRGLVHNNAPTIHGFTAALRVMLDDSVRDQPTLVEIFKGVLFSSSNGIYFSNDPSYVGIKPIENDYALGALVARSTAPADVWMMLWESMAAVRFRLRHAPYGCDGIPDDAIRYLPMVGIAAFDWLVSSEENRLSEAMPLWEVLWNAVYGSWLNSVRGNNDIWAHYILLILVRRPLLCGDDKEECADDLRPYLKKMGYAPRLVSEVACSLKLNVASGTMESLRSDIEPSIVSFLKSEKEETVKPVRHPSLAKACGELYS